MASARIYTTLFVFAITTVGSVAGMRLSFLDDPCVQTELTAVLKESGCSEPTCDALRHVMAIHNYDIRYDREQMGTADKGWYSYESPQALLDTMPYPFFQTPTTGNGLNQHTLTCFDVAALLVRDLAPEDFAPSLWPRGNGLLSRFDRSDIDGVSLAAQSGELYPLNRYQYFTGQETRDEREVGFIIGLRALRHAEASATSNGKSAEAAVELKLSDLERKGLRLDGLIKPLVVHYVQTDHGFVGGEHIGLLIEQGGSSYYLEKNGAPGPFIFLQADSQQPIIDYVAEHYETAFRSDSDLAGSIMVISLGSEIVFVKDYGESREAEQVPGADAGKRRSTE